jgi:hypothetical protein
MKTVPGVFYACYKASEVPRYAVIDGRRFEVREVLERKRTLAPGTGAVEERFRCRLEDGRIVDIIAPAP